MEYQEFNVGDIVRIVDKPYYDCPFSWASGMDMYCSREAEIKSKEYSAYFKTYVYRISADNTNYAWCGNCFEPLQELEIETASDDELLEFLL